MPAATPGLKSSGFPPCETRPAFPPSGFAPAAPVEADRHRPSVPGAIDPTAVRVARQILPDSARPRLHCPGWPATREQPGGLAAQSKTHFPLPSGGSWEPDILVRELGSPYYEVVELKK